MPSVQFTAFWPQFSQTCYKHNFSLESAVLNELWLQQTDGVKNHSQHTIVIPHPLVLKVWLNCDIKGKHRWTILNMQYNHNQTVDI